MGKKREEVKDGEPYYFESWAHTITSVIADKKGNIRTKGFKPGEVYRIVQIVDPEPLITQIPHEEMFPDLDGCEDAYAVLTGQRVNCRHVEAAIEAIEASKRRQQR